MNDEIGNGIRVFFVTLLITVMWPCPVISQPVDSEPTKKTLNNLVTELLDVDALGVKPYQEIVFTNPRKGWIFISSRARVMHPEGTIQIAINTERNAKVIEHGYGRADTLETMQFLEAGKHKIRIWTEPTDRGKLPSLERLVVRTVPAMMYCGVPTVSLGGYGPYDMDFLAKDVLPNINVIIGSGERQYESWQKQWKQRGGQWYQEQNIPSLVRSYLKDVPQPLTGDYTYKYWTECDGFTNPYLDGVLADEFLRRVGEDFPAYTEAIKKIAKDKRFQDKAVHAWCGPMYGNDLATELAQTVVACGYKIAWEVYVAERPTAEAVKRHFQTDVRKMMKGWEKILPGFSKDLIFVLGIMCAPPQGLNVNPEVDYKVHLDLQFQHLATAPEYEGLFGIMVYKSRYADEESVRWSGRLFRHYCIEGNTDLLSKRYGYTYKLDHIQNADFTNGLVGWTISQAEPGSIEAGEMKELGCLLGRYNAPSGTGDSYVRMKRSTKKPNKISQTIRNLQPGQKYTMKMMVADLQDVSMGRCIEKKHGVSVNIDGVDLIPSESFVWGWAGISLLGPFQDQKSGPWYNIHRWVFKAKGTTAELTLSDWTNDKTPSGSSGQELMCNFIEIQPYYEK